MTSDLKISDIAELLKPHCVSIVRDIFPKARKQGNYYMIGSLSGEAGKSLSIGIKTGIWKDHASGEGGDLIELISLVQFNDNKKEAVSWAKKYLGITEGNAKQLQAKASKKAKLQDEINKQDKEAKRKWAYDKLWQAASMDLEGSPVESYLKSRWMDITDFYYTGAIRYHNELWDNGKSYHGMVCAIIDSQTNKFLTCHRIYLEKSNNNIWQKANIESPKKVAGPYHGGYFMAKPSTEDKEYKSYIITEGIEDALALSIHTDYAVVAAISLANIGNITIEQPFRQIIVYADNDEHPQAIDQLQSSVAKLKARYGKRVYVKRSPIGKDANDYHIYYEGGYEYKGGEYVKIAS